MTIAERLKCKRCGGSGLVSTWMDDPVSGDCPDCNGTGIDLAPVQLLIDAAYHAATCGPQFKDVHEELIEALKPFKEVEDGQ